MQAAAKVFASETAWWVTDQTVQIFAGWGYTGNCTAEHHVRDPRTNLIYWGTSEAQRLVISRGLLKAGAYDLGLTLNPFPKEEPVGVV